MEQVTYHVQEIANGIWAIDEFSMVYCYVLEGSKSAAVLDAGTGVSDLKSVVDSLVSKPYTVLATHAHMDHVGGIGQFHELHIHSADIPCFEFPEQMNPVSTFKRRQICERAIAAYGDALPFDPDNLEPVDLSQITCLPFEDGAVFDLGGRTLEAIHIPGHTKGSCCFLVREDRVLFAGDNFGLALILPLGGSDRERIQAWLEGAEKLSRRSGEFDLICAGHYCPLERSWFTDMLSCARKAAAGELAPQLWEADEMRGPMYHDGSVGIAIDPENVRNRDFRRIRQLRRY